MILFLIICSFFVFPSKASSESSTSFKLEIPKLYTDALKAKFSDLVSKIEVGVVRVNEDFSWRIPSTLDRSTAIALFQAYSDIVINSLVYSSNLEIYERYEIAKDVLLKYFLTYTFNPWSLLGYNEDDINRSYAKIIRFTNLFSKEEYLKFIEVISEDIFIEKCLPDIMQNGKFQPECLLKGLSEEDQKKALALFDKVKGKFNPVFTPEMRRTAYFGRESMVFLNGSFVNLDSYLVEYSIYESLATRFRGKKEAFDFVFCGHEKCPALFALRGIMDVLGLLGIIRDDRKKSPSAALVSGNEKFNSIKENIIKIFKQTHHLNEEGRTFSIFDPPKDVADRPGLWRGCLGSISGGDNISQQKPDNTRRNILIFSLASLTLLAIGTAVVFVLLSRRSSTV